jgi:putative ATPase
MLDLSMSPRSPDSPSLFDAAPASSPAETLATAGPLANRMRPRTLDEYVGQAHMLGPGKLLRRVIDEAAARSNATPFPSLIFWGPPGTGKTTLALLLSQAVRAEFVQFSAVSSGVKEAREVIANARDRLARDGRRTVLFVDEIHRFNKSQQDAFLPAIEDGTITLIGATTENPSFEINNALLSRARVFVLKALEPADLRGLLRRALEDHERGLGELGITATDDALDAIAVLAGGDARKALNALEIAAQVETTELTRDTVLAAFQREDFLYDKNGEEHYNLISALHKAVRRSDPDASLYYLAAMIAGGEDPLFIARRLVRAAVEDIGLADPQALVQAIAAKDAAELMGYPECDVALAQAAVYLACAPKSNSIYKAMGEAMAEVKRNGVRPVPLYFRNAPTSLMKDLGYGKGYEYDHDQPHHISPQPAMPEGLEGRRFYEPGELGFEKDLRRRIEFFDKVRKRS